MQILIWAGAIFFVVPFVVWSIMWFLKYAQNEIRHSKKIIGFTFLGCLLISIICFVVAILIS